MAAVNALRRPGQGTLTQINGLHLQLLAAPACLHQGNHNGIGLLATGATAAEHAQRTLALLPHVDDQLSKGLRFTQKPAFADEQPLKQLLLLLGVPPQQRRVALGIGQIAQLAALGHGPFQLSRPEQCRLQPRGLGQPALERKQGWRVS